MGLIIVRFGAVIFDLDGTLVDTLADLENSMNAVLKKFGYPVHPPDSYRYFVGDGVEMLVRRALPPDSVDDCTVKRCVEAMEEEYSRRWNDKIKLYEGIPELLSYLEEAGIPKAVLSNKPHDFTCLIVETILSQWSFAEVRGAKPSVPKKPDPGVALNIAVKLGVPPQQILYLGDTNVDMRTANRANMFAVGALWGFRTVEELIESGAKAVVETPTEVIKLMDECI
jgi:phosphoglycolate phosphatase